MQCTNKRLTWRGLFAAHYGIVNLVPLTNLYVRWKLEFFWMFVLVESTKLLWVWMLHDQNDGHARCWECPNRPNFPMLHTYALSCGDVSTVNVKNGPSTVDLWWCTVLQIACIQVRYWTINAKFIQKPKPCFISGNLSCSGSFKSTLKHQGLPPNLQTHGHAHLCFQA
jgi:hypothetical protein